MCQWNQPWRQKEGRARPGLWTCCPSIPCTLCPLTNYIAWPPWVTDQWSNIFFMLFPPSLVSMSGPPPGAGSLPGRRPGRTQIARRDKMFGSLEKRGGKLNLTPGKAPGPGRKLGRLAYTPQQSCLGQRLAWGLGRAQSRPALVGGGVARVAGSPRVMKSLRDWPWRA